MGQCLDRVNINTVVRDQRLDRVSINTVVRDQCLDRVSINIVVRDEGAGTSDTSRSGSSEPELVPVTAGSSADRMRSPGSPPPPRPERSSSDLDRAVLSSSTSSSSSISHNRSLPYYEVCDIKYFKLILTICSLFRSRLWRGRSSRPSHPAPLSSSPEQSGGAND